MTNCKCDQCDQKRYSDEWDAYYCVYRNIWLEIGCGSDCDEYHCSKRPKCPDMERLKRRRKETQNNVEEMRRIKNESKISSKMFEM